MFQFNRFELECFINKVFYYYNGKINTCNNKCRLFVNWCNFSGSGCGARFMQPDIITVFPMVLAKWQNEQQLDADAGVYENGYKIMLIESIIHELFHADQFFMRGLYEEYQVEYPVITETTLYMANHQNEIYDVFGVVLDMDFTMINSIIPQVYVPYQRKTPMLHVLSVVAEILFGQVDLIDKFVKAIESVVNNKSGSVDLLLLPLGANTIDAVFFELMDGETGELCNIYDFNEYVYKYFCHALERGCTVDIKSNYDNYHVLVANDIILCNVMCTIDGKYKDVERG